MSTPIYLDHAASTPPAAEVVDAMLPWLQGAHANPHADHSHGQRAAAAIEQARYDVASLIGAEGDEIVFTSGATESNNLALHGLLGDNKRSRLLAVTAAAHKSILEVARTLLDRGVAVRELPIDDTAAIAMDSVDKALRECEPVDVGVVSITHGNNEVGTLQSLAPIAAVAHGHSLLVHVDAAQSAGKVLFDVGASDIDLASLSSHKMYGPMGIGALYVARHVASRLQPIMQGGGQEGGLRPGTVPVFLAVGFGVAARIARRTLVEDARHLNRLSDQFLAALRDKGVEYSVIGDPVQRLPGHLSLHFPHVDAATLLDRVSSEVSASTGSACTAGQIHASHVLRSIGLSEQQATEVVRITLGRYSVAQDVERSARAFQQGIARQRGNS